MTSIYFTFSPSAATSVMNVCLSFQG